MHFNSPSQFEADRMGLILAYRTGYGTYGLPDVVQTIGQTYKSDSSVALLFKTHPSPDERLAKLGDGIGDKLDNAKAEKSLENRLYKLKAGGVSSVRSLLRHLIIIVLNITAH